MGRPTTGVTTEAALMQTDAKTVAGIGGFQYGGFLKWGYPEMFITENLMKMDDLDWFGGTHILGNLHTCIMCYIFPAWDDHLQLDFVFSNGVKPSASSLLWVQ